MGILKNILPVGILFAFPSLANAVIYAGIYAGSDNGEAQSTADSATAAQYGDPGFNNVGVLNGASCVYLGTYATGSWVISACHVWDGGGTSVNFGGSLYNTIPDSYIGLTNPDQTPSDLCIFRVNDSIASNVSLHNVSIIENTPPVGTTVRMIGNGKGRASELSYWDATWTETTQGPYATFGFMLTDLRAIRWADNTVGGTNAALQGSGTIAFLTLFGSLNGNIISYEPGLGQATTGDSGGATFAYINNEWVLAGILEAVGSILTSPSGIPMDRVFLGEITASADLSVYREQIMAAIPETGTLIPLIIAGAGAVALRRHRKNKKRARGRL